MLIFKVCNKCQEKKEISYFVTNKATYDGHLNICKVCHNKSRRENRNTEKDVEYNKKYLKERPEVRLYNSAKSRAKKENLDFNLDLSDIIIPEECPYLKSKITNVYGTGFGYVPTNPSIDKVIPILGYVKGNIEVISCKANAMKQNASREELITFAKSVLEKEILE